MQKYENFLIIKNFLLTLHPNLDKYQAACRLLEWDRTALSQAFSEGYCTLLMAGRVNSAFCIEYINKVTQLSQKGKLKNLKKLEKLKPYAL